MTMTNKNKNGGLIKTAFMMIIGAVMVCYFVDIKSIADSKFDLSRLKNNFHYLKTLSVHLWEGYMSASADSAWNKIFKK